MSYCTVINCIDGRVQLPVHQFARAYFFADYVDMVTTPGATFVLTQESDSPAYQALCAGVEVSLDKHESLGIVVAGHFDCAANPASEKEQVQQIHDATALLRKRYPQSPVVGVWVDEHWLVQVVSESALGLGDV